MDFGDVVLQKIPHLFDTKFASTQISSRSNLISIGLHYSQLLSFCLVVAKLLGFTLGN